MIAFRERQPPIHRGTLVMVRGAHSEPRALLAVAAGTVVVEVAAENREKHASMGFPRRRVFARDEALFRELLACYRERRPELLSALWARAVAPDLAGLPPLDAPTEPRGQP